MKYVRQEACVSQDAEPPESVSILRKGTKVLGPIRRVRFTNATQRHANIRENKGPSLGKIQVKVPHRRSPYAMKFEDTGAMCPRRRVETGQEHLKARRKGKSYILFAFQ